MFWWVILLVALVVLSCIPDAEKRQWCSRFNEHWDDAEVASDLHTLQRAYEQGLLTDEQAEAFLKAKEYFTTPWGVRSQPEKYRRV